MAIKLHFTTDRYDVFQANGRVSISSATFEKRNDRFLFEKIGRKFDKPRDLIDYFVANFAYGNKSVIYSNESTDYHETWMKRKESRTHMFYTQLSYIERHLETENLKYEDLFSIDNNVPHLLNLYVGGYVHLETMVILDEFENFLPQWEPLIMLWGDQLRIINKTKKFVKFDKTKIQSIYQQYKATFAEL
jgi:hypothetical protein